MRVTDAGLAPASAFWNAAMTTSFRAVLSPCIGVCSLGDDGLCEGCLRTVDEIAAWSRLSDAERLHVMETLLPAREAAAGRA